MDQTTRLLAIESIKQLKARYFRCVDGKDWAGFAGVFAPDVHFDITDDVPGCVLQDPGAIVDMTRQGLTGCVSVHHGHCPEITLHDADNASGIWAMEDRLRWNEGAASPIRALHGYGHYIETYRRIDGEWRIQTLKLARLRVDIEPWPAINAS